MKHQLGYRFFVPHDYQSDVLHQLLHDNRVKFLSKNFEEIKCLECGKQFKTKNVGTGAKYCSGGCRNKASRKRNFDRHVEEEIARRKALGLL